MRAGGVGPFDVRVSVKSQRRERTLVQHPRSAMTGSGSVSARSPVIIISSLRAVVALVRGYCAWSEMLRWHEYALV